MVNICPAIRIIYKGPIMVLTNNHSEKSQINAFDVGIDDYLVKPISSAILSVRIDALLKRVQKSFNPASPDVVKVGDITLFPLAQKCQVRDKPVNLSTFEFRLLGLLLVNAGQILTRDLIYQTLLGRAYNGEERTVDVRVSKLRDKLGHVGLHQTKIETVWGKGYILTEVIAA